jgi:hypothetical protein
VDLEHGTVLPTIVGNDSDGRRLALGNPAIIERRRHGRQRRPRDTITS